MMNPLSPYYDEHNKIWSGGKEDPYYHGDCSIGTIVFNTMKSHPKDVIQIFDKDGVTTTNNEALTAAVRIAQHLKSMGLRHADIVGIAARNSTYVMPVAVACFMNCTPFHSVNPANDEKTLTHIFEITKPKVIFCDGQDYDVIRSVTKQFGPHIYTLRDHINGVSGVQDLLSPTTTEYSYRPESQLQGGDQTVAILCSSGSTGLPKGVCISNHKLLAQKYDCLPSSEDVIYTSTGIDWYTGLLMMIATCTNNCTRILSDKPFSAAEFVQLVKKYNINYAILAPRHVASLIQCPTATPTSLASIRKLLTGGGAVPFSSLQALQPIANNAVIGNVYGMTEIGIVAFNYGLDRTTSTGRVVPGLRVRIVDDDGKNLGSNENGEIYVHQTRGWNGYYGNLLETQRALDTQGWYHTGDVGYIDEEHYLYVVDRKKEISKYQGMHYWPTEIENCITELPDVIDACVIGIVDESDGDLAGALVSKVEGSSLSAENIKDYVKKQLVMPHKQLNAGVLFVQNLPQNQNGKTSKKEAKALFIAAMQSIDH